MVEAKATDLGGRDPGSPCSLRSQIRFSWGSGICSISIMERFSAGQREDWGELRGHSARRPKARDMPSHLHAIQGFGVRRHPCLGKGKIMDVSSVGLHAPL